MHLRIWNVSACGYRHGDRLYRAVFFRGFNFFSRYWFSLLKSTMTVTFFNIISGTLLLLCNKSKRFSSVVSFSVPGIKSKRRSLPIKVFYSPTDAHVNCVKNSIKIYINSSDMFRCSHTIIRERITSMVMWLHICSHITTDLTTPMYLNRLF
jgi:hypothetical protein